MSKEVLLPLVISRLALMLVGWLAMSMLHQPARPGIWEIGRSGKIEPIEGQISTQNRPLTNMWSRWDAGWYAGIAENGYQFTAGRPSNVAFFPIYPLSMRVVRALLASHKGSAWMLAGIIVSNTALAVALIYLWLLVRLEFDEATARRAVLYLLVFPMTLFLSAVYSESVFLACAIASFYHARRQQWWLAGLLGACTALSRPTGVMIAVGLAAEYALQCEWNWRKLRPDILAIALVPLALAGFLAFLHYAEGSATAVVQAQEAWGLRLQPQWRTLAPFFVSGLDVKGTLVDLGFTLGYLALVIAVCFRMRASYALYSVAYLLFITMWGSLESVARYGLGLFPVIMLLALLGRNAVFDRIYLPISAALAALFMAVFAVWGWVA
ncbi:MAG: hypothetical protein M3Y80_05480 [Verrucomicrobiota bacterium]|nr:hypothetical protein [Verrucomicrobiota bacterium]